MNSIPNYFHFVFGFKPQTEPFHLAHYLCLSSCIAVNQPQRVYFHYKHLPYGKWWDRIKDKLTLNEVSTDNFVSNYAYEDKTIGQYRYAHVSDIVRLEMLDKFGGIYADMDTLFINPVPTWFFSKEYIMGKEKVDYTQVAGVEAGGSLCNAWIASAPGAEFGKIWLDKIKEEFDGTWSAHSTFLPYKLSQEYPDLIHVEPETSFFSLDWTQEGVKSIFENQVEVKPNNYSLHLWSHLWWSKTRLHYTTFHAGKITENYVKFAPTTFSSIARRFLPPGSVASYWLFRVQSKFAPIDRFLILLNYKFRKRSGF